MRHGLAKNCSLDHPQNTRGQIGASLAEYAIIVSILSLVLVLAAPKIGLGIGRVSCSVVTLGNYFYVVTNGHGRCIKSTMTADLSGDSTPVGYTYW